MRFRLRYLHHDLELSEGEFAIGRSADCQLSLDDPLVSRRHGLLVVTKDEVTVEDLGSRNGVVVNGARITDRTVLHPGDKIVMGSQELTLLLGRDQAGFETTNVQLNKNTIPTLMAIRREATGEIVPADATVRPPAERTPTEGIDPSTERRADVFNLLGRVADKAFAMGRADEAERLLASALAEVVEASRTGKRLPPALIDVAARFAAKLATATGKGSWIDCVVDMYDAQLRPCPAPVVDELYGALRKVSAIDLARLRVYVAHLRERQATLGPAERFLLQRIEGLERLASLR
ncbi:MAG: FHA domain-containing protein [Myxococcales bacterium]|nr:FHA domain-containing protein [Myxococcales bacterium]